jgi:hypothetical protein
MSAKLGYHIWYRTNPESVDVTDSVMIRFAAVQGDPPAPLTPFIR